MKHTWMLLNVVYYLFSISFIQNELQLGLQKVIHWKEANKQGMLGIQRLCVCRLCVYSH